MHLFWRLYMYALFVVRIRRSSFWLPMTCFAFWALLRKSRRLTPSFPLLTYSCGREWNRCLFNRKWRFGLFFRFRLFLALVDFPDNNELDSWDCFKSQIHKSFKMPLSTDKVTNWNWILVFWGLCLLWVNFHSPNVNRICSWLRSGASALN